MRNDYLLNGALACRLYEHAKALPIYDYHCHLNPKEIWEDREFDNIGEVWLGGDHYKWRLMRGADINEEKITGQASYREKFSAYASALSGAVGNPLAVWSHAELSTCFGIDTPLTAKTADTIFDEANETIKRKALSPRKLIRQFDVRFIGTTDDPCDDLQYHRLLSADPTFPVRVSPSFRTDNLLNATRKDYPAYLEKLSQVSDTIIDSFDSFLIAIEKRLAFFKANGCVFTDVGISDFPDRIADTQEAMSTFAKLRQGESVDRTDYLGFLGRMFLELGKLYKKYGLVMQLHLSASRNPNTRLFEALGADCGCDCIGPAVCGKDLCRLLDQIDRESGLPETILYCLNPSMNDELASIAGSFRSVRLGAAWWFNDHRDGIIKVLDSLSAIGYLGGFYGMLTDSRSFLSYPRHDYFRRIFCSYVAELWQRGEVQDEQCLFDLMDAVCCDNIRRVIERSDNIQI